MKHGWAATGQKSIADVALLAWLSSVIFNPYYEEREKLLNSKELSHLKIYWGNKKELIEDYLDEKRITSIV